MVLRAVLLTSTLLLGACGSGNENFSATIVEYDVSGVAVVGLIHEGEINAYQFEDGVKGSIIGSGYLDSDGSFSLVASVEAGPEVNYILVCLSSGSYTDEVTGNLEYIEIEDEICATHLLKSIHSTVISAFSHYAVALVSYKTEGNIDIISAIIEANSTVTATFGSPFKNTIPRSLTLPASNPNNFDDSLKLGLMLASFSQLVSDLTGDENAQGSLPVVKYFNLVYDDIRYDGVLNGVTEFEQITLGDSIVYRSTYTSGIAKAALDFLGSELNVAQPNYQAAYLELGRFVSSTSSLYPALPDGEPLPSLDF
jgi:hypothetical protein